MILFRYLSRDILLTSFAVSLALMVISVSARFIKYLSEAAAGEMAGDILFWVVLFRLPSFLELILPLGFMLAVLLVYGRLYVESELIVMQACGVSKRKLLTYTMIPALLMAIIAGTLSMVITPKGLQEFNAIWQDPSNFSGLGTMQPGRFQSTQSGEGVTYVGELSGDKQFFNEVFLAGTDRDGVPFVVLAERGDLRSDLIEGDRTLRLYQGVRYQGLSGEANFTQIEFEQYAQVIGESIKAPPPAKSDGKDTSELWGSDDIKDVAALQWRIAVPLSMPLLALIALPLSETNHRRGRFIKLLPGIVLYIVYIVLLSVSRGAIEKGVIPPEIGLWWVHICFLLIGIALYKSGEIRAFFARST